MPDVEVHVVGATPKATRSLTLAADRCGPVARIVQDALVSPEDPWAAIGRLLPDGDALAAAVAAELGEPVDAVRPTVRIGMLSRRTRPGSDEEVTRGDRGRTGPRAHDDGPLPPARLLDAVTQEELLAEATRLEEAGQARPRDDRRDPAHVRERSPPATTSASS